jgi:hypothetical protein
MLYGDFSCTDTEFGDVTSEVLTCQIVTSRFPSGRNSRPVGRVLCRHLPDHGECAV